MTSFIDREYKKALKEIGRCPSHVKPNLVQRNRNNATAASTSAAAATASTADNQQNIDQWSLPKKPSPIKTQTPAHSFVSNNIFNHLHNSQLSINSTDDKDVHDADDITSTDNQTPVRKSKPPPIHCESETIKSLIALLSPVVASQSALKITDNNNEHKTIFVDNLEDYNKVKNALNTSNIKYYTYTPKATKNKVLVLKGISKEYTANEVKDALTSLKLTDVTICNVGILKVPNNVASRSNFLVHVSPESNTSSLRKIRGLLNQTIRWEILRKPNVFQCHNCQRVGHSSANCHLGFRCVKCNLPHKPGECLRTKEENTPPFCINCNKTGHPANYRGCDYLKFAHTTNIQVKANHKLNAAPRPNAYFNNSHLPPQRQPSSQRTHTGRSFADTIKGRSSSNDLSEPLDVTGQQLQLILGTFKKDIIDAVIDNNISVQQQINANTERIDQLFTLLNTRNGSTH